MADDPLEKLQRSAKTWSRWYDWLQWHFPDEEAHEYAEELTQVEEGRKREIERSPLEIKREMKLLSNTEVLVNTIRLLVALGAFAAPFCFILSRPLFLVPLLDSETVAATWIRVGLAIFCVVPAVMVWKRPFWKNWLAVLWHGCGTFGNGARPRCGFPLRASPPISTRQASPSKKRASSRRNRLTYSNEAHTSSRGNRGTCVDAARSARRAEQYSRLGAVFLFWRLFRSRQG